MENTKDGKEIRKPPPNYVGGIQNQIAESNQWEEQVLGW